MGLEISSLSKEYVKVPVAATVNGVLINPTADAVQFAFMPLGASPASGDFKSASWETAGTSPNVVYYARCLVGPGGTVTLAAGVYVVWVKVTDNPEIPVKQAGTLTVT